jgi:WD40 repeat protein
VTSRLEDPNLPRPRPSLENRPSQAGIVAQCVAFSPDGRYLATASGNSVVRLWSASDGAHLVAMEGHEAGNRAAAGSCGSRAWGRSHRPTPAEQSVDGGDHHARSVVARASDADALIRSVVYLRMLPAALGT